MISVHQRWSHDAAIWTSSLRLKSGQKIDQAGHGTAKGSQTSKKLDHIKAEARIGDDTG